MHHIPSCKQHKRHIIMFRWVVLKKHWQLPVTDLPKAVYPPSITAEYEVQTHPLPNLLLPQPCTKLFCSSMSRFYPMSLFCSILLVHHVCFKQAMTAAVLASNSTVSYRRTTKYTENLPMSGKNIFPDMSDILKYMLLWGSKIGLEKVGCTMQQQLIWVPAGRRVQADVCG